MTQQTHRRLVILLAGGVLMAMLWLAVGTGCDGTSTAEPLPSDRVRRRATAVKAGSPGSNPPVLTDDNWKSLSAGDSIWTDTSGEAELVLDGCRGNLYVFDNSALSVWTCTKQAKEEEEYWCIEEGSAGFNIDCTRRFTVFDTPSALVTIQATAFTVSYLPDSQLTLVTVFRGVVDVAPVLNMDTLDMGAAQSVKPGYFLYTTPGERSREIADVEARTPQPLYKLPLIVYELGIRDWMDDITRWADDQGLLEPTWPFLGVTLDFDGGQLADPRVQEAFVAAIDQAAVLRQAFPGEEVQFTAVIGNESRDASTIPYNPEEALGRLAEAGYNYRQLVTIVFPREDDQVATAAKLIAGALSRIDINLDLAPYPRADLALVIQELTAGGEAVLAVFR